MRKNTNAVHVEGKIYQHDLELKEVKNQQSANFGKKYIAGKLEIVVDDVGLNVLPVDFTYVTETTKNGGKNKTYSELMKIIENGKTWVVDGPELATKIAVNTAIAINDFIAADETPVAQVIMNGGFVESVAIVNENPLARNTFRTDMVITSINRAEASEENHVDADYVSVRGAVFNFRNDLLPVEFVVKNPDGMAYFESLDVTSANPLYTQVWGNVNFMTVNSTNRVESAFGGAMVDNRPRKVKEWVITGALKVPYDFGEENVMTVEELTKAAQNREILLAEKKKQRDEYLATKNAANIPATGFGATPTPTGPAMQGNFKF